MKREPDQAANRSFGLIMAGGLGILAIIRSLIDGRVVWWLAAVAVGFALVGLVVQKWLEPIRRSWMKLAAILGAVNSRVLLTVMYVGIVTPIAVLLRILGKRPIALRPDKGKASYWHQRRADEFTTRRMERQF